MIRLGVWPPTLRMDAVALTRKARRIQPHWSAKHSRRVPPDDRKTGDLMTPSSLTTSSVSPSPTIHDFRQSTMAAARRREGRCIYCTNNALAYKNYCWVRSILFAGARRLICSSSTPTSCWVSQPPSSRRLVAVPWHDRRYPLGTTRIPDSCLVVCDTTAVVAAMPTRTPIHSSGGRTLA